MREAFWYRVLRQQDDTLDFTEQDWIQLSEVDEKLSKSLMRDKLYEAVIHLVTMADGNVESFRFDSSYNAQPKEKQLKDAQLQDASIQRLW